MTPEEQALLDEEAKKKLLAASKLPVVVPPSVKLKVEQDAYNRSNGIIPDTPAPGPLAKTNEQKGIIVNPDAALSGTSKGPIEPTPSPQSVIDQAGARGRALSATGNPTTPIVNPINNLGFNSRAMTMKWIAAGSPGGDAFSPSDAQNFFDKLGGAAQGQDHEFTNAEWQAFGPLLKGSAQGEMITRQREQANERIQSAIAESVAKNPEMSADEYQDVVKKAGGKFSSDLAAIYGARMMPDSIRNRISLDDANAPLWESFAKDNHLDPKNMDLRKQWEGDMGQYHFVLSENGKPVLFMPKDDQKAISDERWQSGRHVGYTKEFTGKELVDRVRAPRTVELYAESKKTPIDWGTKDAFKNVPEVAAGTLSVNDAENTYAIGSRKVSERINKGTSPAKAVDLTISELESDGTVKAVGRGAKLQFRDSLVKATQEEMAKSYEAFKAKADENYNTNISRLNERAKFIESQIGEQKGAQFVSTLTPDQKLQIASEFPNRDARIQTLDGMRHELLNGNEVANPDEVEEFDRFDRAIMGGNLFDAKRENKTLFNIYSTRLQAVQEGSATLWKNAQAQRAEEASRQSEIAAAREAEFNDVKMSNPALRFTPATKDNYLAYVDTQKNIVYQTPGDHVAAQVVSGLSTDEDSALWNGILFQTNDKGVTYVKNKSDYEMFTALRSGGDAGTPEDPAAFYRKFNLTLDAKKYVDDFIATSFGVPGENEITKTNEKIKDRQDAAAIESAIPINPLNPEQQLLRKGTPERKLFVSSIMQGDDWKAKVVLLRAIRNLGLDTSLKLNDRVNSIQSALNNSGAFDSVQNVIPFGRNFVPMDMDIGEMMDKYDQLSDEHKDVVKEVLSQNLPFLKKEVDNLNKINSEYGYAPSGDSKVGADGFTRGTTLNKIVAFAERIGKQVEDVDTSLSKREQEIVKDVREKTDAFRVGLKKFGIDAIGGLKELGDNLPTSVLAYQLGYLYQEHAAESVESLNKILYALRVGTPVENTK